MRALGGAEGGEAGGDGSGRTLRGRLEAANGPDRPRPGPGGPACGPVRARSPAPAPPASATSGGRPRPGGPPASILPSIAPPPLAPFGPELSAPPTFHAGRQGSRRSRAARRSSLARTCRTRPPIAALLELPTPRTPRPRGCGPEAMGHSPWAMGHRVEIGGEATRRGVWLHCSRYSNHCCSQTHTLRAIEQLSEYDSGPDSGPESGPQSQSVWDPGWDAAKREVWPMGRWCRPHSAAARGTGPRAARGGRHAAARRNSAAAPTAARPPRLRGATASYGSRGACVMLGEASRAGAGGTWGRGSAGGEREARKSRSPRTWEQGHLRQMKTPAPLFPSASEE